MAIPSSKSPIAAKVSAVSAPNEVGVELKGVELKSFGNIVAQVNADCSISIRYGGPESKEPQPGLVKSGAMQIKLHLEAVSLGRHSFKEPTGIYFLDYCREACAEGPIGKIDLCQVIAPDGTTKSILLADVGLSTSNNKAFKMVTEAMSYQQKLFGSYTNELLLLAELGLQKAKSDQRVPTGWHSETLNAISAFAMIRKAPANMPLD